jgi:hypothetical protein
MVVRQEFSGPHVHGGTGEGILGFLENVWN